MMRRLVRWSLEVGGLLAFTLWLVFLLNGCSDDPVQVVSVGPTDDGFVVRNDPPSDDGGGGDSGYDPLCSAFMIHAKVVAQGVNAAGEWYMDISCELKDERDYVPLEQGGILCDKIAGWLAFPSNYLEYRGEYCSGHPLNTDGTGPPCTTWGVNDYVEYDQLPHPRGRLLVSQQAFGGGVPMPPHGKRTVGTARFYRTGAVGAQATYAYKYNVTAQYETYPPYDYCAFPKRSPWGHDLTFGAMGTPVTVGPETQFCGLYPGCRLEQEACETCEQ